MNVMTHEEYQRIKHFIKLNYGIDLTDKKVFIESRIGQLIKREGYKSYTAYLDEVLSGSKPEKLEILVNKLTTNHTYFMREKSHFEFLKNRILPEVDKNSNDYDLRIWSSACSSGEEPYTIAMFVSEYFGTRKISWDTRILATDLSSDILKKAITGVYNADVIEDLPYNWSNKYFEKLDEKYYEVSKELKSMVIFRRFNLVTKDFPFKKKFHVIFCRNVLIYFDPPTRTKLLTQFYDCLEPGGYLIIGHSESFPGKIEGFEYVETSIYRKVILNHER